MIMYISELNMTEEISPETEIPRALERYVNKPYGGLFGNSVQVNVVEEIVADPYSNYRPKDLEEIIGASPPAIRRALGDLTTLGLLKKDLSDAQHPIYHPNLDSKKIIALTFLAYAMTDDREGTNLMNTAILDYFIKNIKPEVELSAAATAAQYRYGDTTWNESVIMIANTREGDKITTVTREV
ncbi:hypothetical protein C5S31_07750 [ANME-1 cluster archaeon GoMg2]|nr:hypothetical protein [ANME-1 cluster archaeon GoMg2]